MPHYLSYRSYLKKRFGQPVLKISLNAGFSCPNRDGTKSNRGCLFCDNRSFSPVAISKETILCQAREAITRDHGKHSCFIAYLQPFTNTYGPIDFLRSAYEPLITHPGVVGLAIGTRPDCLPDLVTDYLSDVANRTYLSVELGLQSSSNAVLTEQNRGHTREDFTTACTTLARHNIEVVAHMMVGLSPNFKKDAVDTADFLAGLPVSGVKIHQLMIIQGTPLQMMYEQGFVKTLLLEEYADTLCEVLLHLRPDQHVHRIMADSIIENGLIAPLWSSEKQKSIQFLHDVMDKRELVQGRNYSSRWTSTPSSL